MYIVCYPIAIFVCNKAITDLQIASTYCDKYTVCIKLMIEIASENLNFEHINFMLMVHTSFLVADEIILE